MSRAPDAAVRRRIKQPEQPIAHEEERGGLAEPPVVFS
jgi:hypothetical protein